LHQLHTVFYWIKTVFLDEHLTTTNIKTVMMMKMNEDDDELIVESTVFKDIGNQLKSNPIT